MWLCSNYCSWRLQNLLLPKKPIKDVFGLWQIEGETDFSGKYEIPKVHGTNKVPEDLVMFSNAENQTETKTKAIHFYEFDEKFIDNKVKFAPLIENVFKNYQSIILPDFSVYVDFPFVS